MIADFLGHLGEAATSTAAVAAYIVVVVAWALWVWLRYRLQNKAERILGKLDSDAARNEALRILLGNSPPQGLPRKELMRWSALEARHRSRVLIVVAYLATLTAVIVIVGMALFQPATHEVRKPPVLVESEVRR